MKTIIGLGNPGREYERTPHNVGFLVIDTLASRLDCALHRSFRFRAQTGKGLYLDREVLLVKPATFMNNSGQAVAAILSYRRLSPADIIVVVDDADLSLGQIRVRQKGSSGGHRGLESIVQALGSEEFIRVRAGIGRGPAARDLVSHVLTPFSGAEWTELQNAATRCGDAVLCILERGVEEAMNRFNAREGRQLPMQDRGGESH